MIYHTLPSVSLPGRLAKRLAEEGKLLESQIPTLKKMLDGRRMQFGKIKTGDLIEYGKYHLPSYTETPLRIETPIIWRVLKKDTTKLFLLSEYVLATKELFDYDHIDAENHEIMRDDSYNHGRTDDEKNGASCDGVVDDLEDACDIPENYEFMDKEIFDDIDDGKIDDFDISWPNSFWRRILNNVLFYRCFDMDEQQLIVEAVISTGELSIPVKDKLFLPSLEEISSLSQYQAKIRYFTIDSNNCATLGLYESFHSWWLRDNIATKGYFLYAEKDGTLSSETMLCDSEIGIRPCMWIDYSNIENLKKNLELYLSD